MSVYSGAFTVVLQTMVEPAALGRVFSMYGSITLLPAMVGLLATGYIADTIGIANAFHYIGSGYWCNGIAGISGSGGERMVREEVEQQQLHTGYWIMLSGADR